MCYNTKLTKKRKEIESRFHAVFDELEPYKENSEINAFTYPKTPIISSDETSCIQQFQWGLIPKWAKNDSVKKFTLNARIETLSQKTSFKNYTENQCIILADGFYEWQLQGAKKQKYEIGLENEQMFAFAGLWSSWVDKVSQKTVKSYTLITTEAQGIMKEIHNTKFRMPVILSKEKEKLWLLNKNIDTFRQVDVKLIARKTPSKSISNAQLSIFD